MNLYQADTKCVEELLKSDATHGLSTQEAAKRLHKYGPNKLPETDPDHWFIVFLKQFRSPLIYILVAAAILIGIVGNDLFDAFVISGVLMFNAIISTIQTKRVGGTLKQLQRLEKLTCIVIRNGKREIINTEELVPGDLIFLQEGQRVPADARIVSINGLQVNEATLTGESAAITKSVAPLENQRALGDQTNMLFRDTYITSGSGIALVSATGLQTEVGKIHAIVGNIKTDTPLKHDVDRLSYFILIFISITCVALLGIGLLLGKSLQNLLVTLTALFICVVPEGLPAILTLVLVAGAYRMAQRKVLAKSLHAVETLGRADVIVTDKTGTLTRNEMMVTEVAQENGTYHISGEGYHKTGDISLHDKVLSSQEAMTDLGTVGTATSLLNNTGIKHDTKTNLFTIKGSPTEAALYILSEKIGASREKLDQQYTKFFEIPFSSTLAYHAGFYVTPAGDGIVFLTGSPEPLFKRAADVSEKMRNELERMLTKGLRVIAVGQKKIEKSQIPKGNSHDFSPSPEQFERLLENGITIIALCGMQDAIRPNVPETVKAAQNAGIDVVMSTGDHAKTAQYVAEKVGIYRDGDIAMSGPELPQKSDEEILPILDDITVFSRVSPSEKTRIVSLYHKENKIVAMTGDGVNDAPSLVAADLGIAMGSIGTEVAKNAADLVLLNDSFVGIVDAITEGRHVFRTLRRVFLYFFSTNAGEVVVILASILFNLPLPLTAAQILWLNLITDGFLDVALSTEPKEPGLLKKQHTKKRYVVDPNLLYKTLYTALPMGILSFSVFLHYYNGSIAYARTMTLTTMAMFQWFNAWNCRSEDRSLLQIGLFKNYWLVVATTFVLMLQVAILYTPFLQQLFKTVPLSGWDWLTIVAITFPIILIEEIRKAVAAWWLG